MPKTATAVRTYRFDQMATLINDRVDDPAESGVERYVGLEHLDANSLKLRRWGDITDVESTKLRFMSGDIIFGKRRVYQRKLAVADFEGICSAHAMVLRARAEVVLPDFLPFFMQSDLFMERALAISVGSLSPTINWTDLAQQEFALPPIEEQRRIAVALSASCTLRDRLTEAAVSARETLRALVSSHAAKHPRTTLGDVATLITSGSRGWAEHYSADGPWFLRVTNLRRDSIDLDLDDLQRVQPPAGAEGRRTRVHPGDVLVAVTGAYLGMVAIVPASIPEAYVNQHLALVRLDRKRVDPRFIAHLLTSSEAQRQVWAKNDGATKPGMSLADVAKLRVPCPTLDLQASVATECDRLHQAVKALESRLVATRQLDTSLLAALSEGTP